MDTKYLFFCFVLLVALSSTASATFGYNKLTDGGTVTIINSNFTNFTQLLDAPNSYSGAAGQVVAVKAGEDGLEFVTISAAGNASWNQSFANTLYASIFWNYNQTTPAILYVNTNFWNKTQSYNMTQVDALIAGISGGNASFNQTLTDSKYYAITNPNNYINLTTGQAFNDTALILSVNTSGNIQNLGFLNSTQVNALVSSVNNSANIKALGFINSSDSDVKYLNLSGTNANQNINILGFNFTNTGTGFFTFIGSSAARITTGWFTNVDTTNASVSGFLKLNATGSQASFNGSCSVLTGPTSTLSIC